MSVASSGNVPRPDSHTPPVGMYMPPPPPRPQVSTEVRQVLALTSWGKTLMAVIPIILLFGSCVGYGFKQHYAISGVQADVEKLQTAEKEGATNSQSVVERLVKLETKIDILLERGR